MGESYKKGITIETIGGLLVTAIVSYSSYALGYWPTIKSFFTKLWHLITMPLPIPFWLVFIALGYALYKITKFIGTFFQENHLAYCDDVFFGIRWRWHYPLDVYELSPYCLKCDILLVYREDYHNGSTIICEHCNTKVLDLPRDYVDLKNKVLRQIDRKIRTGEWNNSQHLAQKNV